MTARRPRAEDDTVDIAIPFDDDPDLDALMVRVRDAARGGTLASRPGQPPTSSEADAGELDVVRVLEAQGDWNEQARQELVALLDCIKSLRDDWNEAHAGLCREIARLSAQVAELRASVGAPTPGSIVFENLRSRRAPTSSRRPTKRRSVGGRKPRS